MTIRYIDDTCEWGKEASSRWSLEISNNLTIPIDTVVTEADTYSAIVGND